MAEPNTRNQRFHLLLGDIAMAVAIDTYDRSYDRSPGSGGQPYEPGHLRDRWLAQVTDDEQRRRVCAMANASMGALQRMEGDMLSSQAQRWGIPIDAELAAGIAEHFETKRTALLRYRS